MPEPVAPTMAAESSEHLSRLLGQLGQLGLHTRLLTQPGRLPRLQVISPEATSLTEVISAAPLEGVWWFWWSWAEQIAPVNQLAEAANRIQYVLTPTNAPSDGGTRCPRSA